MFICHLILHGPLNVHVSPHFGRWIWICMRAGLNWSQKGVQRGSIRESGGGDFCNGGGGNLKFLLSVSTDFRYFLYWIRICFGVSSEYWLFHRFYVQTWHMQIRGNKTDFIMNFEALYFCSWCLLIFNILICGDPVETSPLLPRHRAYPRRRTSSEKTL